MFQLSSSEQKIEQAGNCVQLERLEAGRKSITEAAELCWKGNLFLDLVTER